MSYAWIAVAVFGLAACGGAQAGGNESAYARFVAQRTAADCGRMPTPTPAHAAHLQRLCACMETRILRSGIREGDRDDAVNAKVQESAAACLAEVGDGSDLRPPADTQ